MARSHVQEPGTDRERRALLEQLQTELREARAALAVEVVKPGEMLALEQRVNQARERADAVGRKRDRLRFQKQGLTDRIALLREQLEEAARPWKRAEWEVTVHFRAIVAFVVLVLLITINVLRNGCGH